jgi:hypothetical protein
MKQISQEKEYPWLPTYHRYTGKLANKAVVEKAKVGPHETGPFAY